MYFENRLAAGQALAAALIAYRQKQPLVLAIPRGGVVVAAAVVKALAADLDLIIPRKIGAPFNEEFAIGAVTQDGTLLLNEEVLASVQITADYIAAAKARQIAEIKRRMEYYRGARPQPVINGRTVILVDDGIATGFTVMAALRSLRKAQPAELILAVPVAPPATLARLRQEVDRVVCLHAPAEFWGVGQFYREFTQVSDQEVIALLQRIWQDKVDSV